MGRGGKGKSEVELGGDQDTEEGGLRLGRGQQSAAVAAVPFKATQPMPAKMAGVALLDAKGCKGLPQCQGTDDLKSSHPWVCHVWVAALAQGTESGPPFLYCSIKTFSIFSYFFF